MKSIVRFWLLLILILNSVYSFAQDFIKISGKILDSESNTAIPYVSISILGKSIGTIANNTGEFAFNIPKEYFNDSITFSSMGYKNLKICVKDKQPETIFLYPYIYNLESVTIIDKEISSKEILKKVKQNLKNNYKSEPYIADTYYREYTKEDSTFVRAHELALSIYNDGILSIRNYYPTKIEGIRLSKNLSKNAKLIQMNLNELNLLFTDNWTIIDYLKSFKRVKFRVDTIEFLNKQFVYILKGRVNLSKNDTISNKNTFNIISDKNGNILSNEELSTSDLADENDTLIEKATYNELKLNKNSSYYEDIELHVNASDFGIIYAKYIVKPPRNSSIFWIKELETITTFEKQQNSYFPKLMIFNQETVFYSENKEVTKKTYSLMTLNKIKFNVKPLKEEETIGKTCDNYYLDNYKYNAKFWDNYNYFPDDKLRKKVFKDLGKTH